MDIETRGKYSRTAEHLQKIAEMLCERALCYCTHQVIGVLPDDVPAIMEAYQKLTGHSYRLANSREWNQEILDELLENNKEKYSAFASLHSQGKKGADLSVVTKEWRQVSDSAYFHRISDKYKDFDVLVVSDYDKIAVRRASCLELLRQMNRRADMPCMVFLFSQEEAWCHLSKYPIRYQKIDVLL